MSELNNKMLVFIDEANITQTFKRYNKRINWLLMREYFDDLCRQYDVTYCDLVVFIGLQPDIPELSMYRNKKIGFIKFLQYIGINTQVREGLPTYKYTGVDPLSYKANVDVLMTVRSMQIIENENPKIVLFVTNDNDFAPLLDAVKKENRQVIVAGITDDNRSNIGTKLKEIADDILNIGELLPKFIDYR